MKRRGFHALDAISPEKVGIGATIDGAGYVGVPFHFNRKLLDKRPPVSGPTRQTERALNGRAGFHDLHGHADRDGMLEDGFKVDRQFNIDYFPGRNSSVAKRLKEVRLLE